jgi:hypothetical protein
MAPTSRSLIQIWTASYPLTGIDIRIQQRGAIEDEVVAETKDGDAWDEAAIFGDVANDNLTGNEIILEILFVGDFGERNILWVYIVVCWATNEILWSVSKDVLN